MKSLDQFNKERSELYNNNKPRLNGTACPECGKELYDSDPTMVLASYPPKLNVHCECGYRGYRIR